ncbi:MAG TPA: DUF4388 domain-containing protein [Blastocatellia bacterium]|jgi:hypothetical protein|nr:DUF4388 domain-containing protein [Blastocatellia bacterium]
MNDKERRSAKRITHICEVECEGAGISRLSTRINDLSVTGVFIDSMTCFSVGSILKLRFRVRDAMVETEGEVRYSMPQVGMGVRFVNLKPEYRAILESLIEGKPMPARPVAAPPPGEAQRNVLEPPNIYIPSAHVPAQNVLLGNFALVSMFDVIQMVENSRLTGALAITSPTVTGEIHFNEGRIVGAKAGPSSGGEAITKMLGASEGAFEFNKSDYEYQLTMRTTSNMALLLDLLRVKDEEAAMM